MSHIPSYYIVSKQATGDYFLCADGFLRTEYTCAAHKSDTVVYRRLGAARNRLRKLNRKDSVILANIPQPDGSSIEKIVA